MENEIVQVVIVFLAMVSVSFLIIGWLYGRKAKKIELTDEEFLRENFDYMMEKAEENFREHVVNKGVEYVVIPTKAVYDVLEEPMASFLYFVIRDYQEKFGEINVDAEGRSFEVQVRGKDGRFV